MHPLVWISVQPLPAATAARAQHAQQEPQHSDAAANGKPLLLLVEQLRLRLRLYLRLFLMQLHAQAPVFLTQLRQLHLIGVEGLIAAARLGALRFVYDCGLTGFELAFGWNGSFFLGMQQG